MADGAVVGPALGDRGAADDTSSTGGAPFPRSGVHPMLALELARPPIDSHVLGVRQRRSAGGDRLLEDRHDRLGKAALGGRTKTVAPTRRPQAGAMADLVGVDVADAGDERLIEEQRLERAASATEPRSKCSEVDAVPKRVRSKSSEFRHLFADPIGIEDDHLAEGPRIDEEHATSVVEMGVNVSMGRSGACLVDEEYLSAHAQVNHDRASAIKPDHEVLAVPIDPLDPGSNQSCDQGSAGGSSNHALSTDRDLGELTSGQP